MTVVAGGVPYLILGGPALYYWRRAGYHSPLSAACLGFGINAGLFAVASVVFILLEGLQDAHKVLFFAIPGFMFAMFWCAGFAFLYNRFTRLSKEVDQHDQPQ